MKEGDYVRAYGISSGDAQPQEEPDIGILTRIYDSYWWEVTVKGRKFLVFKNNIQPLPELEALLHGVMVKFC